MSWTRSSSSGVDGYQVQRRTTTSSAWGSTTTLSRTAASHTFTSLARDTQYSMRIRAYDGTCMSPYVTATARTDMEGRISIRKTAAKNLEVRFQLRGQTERIAPTNRFASISRYQSRSTWLKSSNVTTTGGAILGRIGVLFDRNGDGMAPDVEVGFFIHGVSTTTPYRPRLRIFAHETATVNRWGNSSWFSFRPVASTSGSSDDEMMDAAPEGYESPPADAEEDELGAVEAR